VELVFSNPSGTPLDDSRLRKRFDLAMAETQITGHVLYDARHSYASTLLARCRDFVYVAAQLGQPARRPRWITTPISCRLSITAMPIFSTNPKRIGSDLAVARTNWVSRLKNLLNLFDFLEPPAGFEPATC
jgi:hypothetical protein